MGHSLLIVTPDRKTRRVTFEEEEMSLGRAHSNELCYAEDASLSRRHLVLGRDRDGVWAEDLGSKNGTLLNGSELHGRQALRPGDRLSAGQLIITVVDADGETGDVVFIPDTGSHENSATVMTSLEGLLSNEVTEPVAPEAIKDAVGATAGAVVKDRGKSFDSPVVRALFRAGRELAGHRPLSELFPLILDLSIETVGAERGIVMTLEGGRLVSKAVHGEGFRISTTVRDQVLNEKTSLLVRDMAQEEAFREQLSITGQQIHTMMAAPLQTENKVIGLIYVDSRSWVREFTPDDLNLLTVLANVAAIRIEREHYAQLEQENQQAAIIQRGILPQEAPNVEHVNLAGHNAPCQTVGGDYYDFIHYPDGRVAVVLADVAGKGVSAALLMSNLQARVQILAEEPSDLGKFMTRLDQTLARHCPTNRFITMFMAIIDPVKGTMEWCNAGHNPPLLVRSSGEVERLTAAGTVLGILPDLGYEQQTGRLEKGDLLAIFSDGVTESANTEREEFGEQRLADLLAAQREKPAATIIQSVLESVDEWTGSAPAEDDVTLVVARRTS